MSVNLNTTAVGWGDKLQKEVQIQVTVLWPLNHMFLKRREKSDRLIFMSCSFYRRFDFVGGIFSPLYYELSEERQAMEGKERRITTCSGTSAEPK